MAPDRTTAPRPARGGRVGLIGGILALSLVVVAGVVLTRGAPSGEPSAVTDGATATSTERSLVVLPFTSVGGDTANSYFAAGIADELTSALMQIPGLRLAGRASAARVKEQGGAAPARSARRSTSRRCSMAPSGDRAIGSASRRNSPAPAMNA
jgi:hypothetical protein